MTSAIDRRSTDTRRQILGERDVDAVVARDGLGAKQPRADDLGERDGAQVGRLRRVRLTGVDSPSMKRFSRSDSSSITSSSSRWSSPANATPRPAWPRQSAP